MAKIKKFPILYKYTSKGQIQQWQIVADGDTFYTIEGIKDGKLTTSHTTKCTPKNLGKRNETTGVQQALAEAQAKFKKKQDKGYNEKITDKKEYFEPMLASPLEECDIEWSNEEVKKFIQPKLDGLRSVGARGGLMSRNGKPFVSCPHLIHNEEGVILDGELYNHELRHDFNKISSLCRKMKPTAEELEESAEKVQYWLYDLPSVDDVFSKRYETLEEWLNNNDNSSYILVPTYEVTSMEEAIECFEDFKKKGYEGAILRIDSKYENKRSKNLIKIKDFVDSEFTIIGYEEGKGGRTGTIGKFRMRHDKYEDEWFESNVKGDFEYLREIWKERDSYIGKTATIKYFNRTPRKKEVKKITDNHSNNGDVPRFPYIIKIAREDYE
jgi:DNA ligase-1